jgi:hypothetical protein
LVAGSIPALGAMDNYQNFDCVDCGINTLDSKEYYMVSNSVWLETKLKTDEGMLCISCLESRIGRNLTSKDFPDLPINTQIFFPKSSLFLSRIQND